MRSAGGMTPASIPTGVAPVKPIGSGDAVLAGLTVRACALAASVPATLPGGAVPSAAPSRCLRSSSVGASMGASVRDAKWGSSRAGTRRRGKPRHIGWWVAAADTEDGGPQPGGMAGDTLHRSNGRRHAGRRPPHHTPQAGPRRRFRPRFGASVRRERQAACAGMVICPSTAPSCSPTRICDQTFTRQAEIRGPSSCSREHRQHHLRYTRPVRANRVT